MKLNLKFENSCRHQLKIPGCGLPVPIELPAAERFAHGFGQDTRKVDGS
jgi:predicted small lipoprotein YifL